MGLGSSKYISKIKPDSSKDCVTLEWIPTTQKDLLDHQLNITLDDAPPFSGVHINVHGVKQDILFLKHINPINPHFGYSFSKCDYTDCNARLFFPKILIEFDKWLRYCKRGSMSITYHAISQEK